jgi:hypothetical protein
VLLHDQLRDDVQRDLSHVGLLFASATIERDSSPVAETAPAKQLTITLEEVRNIHRLAEDGLDDAHKGS